MTLPIIILAGGLASRLRPITKKIPKSLIEVAGVPFVVRQLNYLKKQNIEKVIMCVGHMGEMIEEFLQNGEELGLRIEYSYDGSTLLGTGGAVKKASEFVDDRFLILYGDSFLPINFNEVENAFDSQKYKALMTVVENKNQWDKSNAIFKDEKLVKYDKENPCSEMNHIDYGLGILSKELFSDYATETNFDLSEVYNKLSIENKLQGFEVTQRFYEIGSYQGLKETETYFLEGDI